MLCPVRPPPPGLLLLLSSTCRLLPVGLTHPLPSAGLCSAHRGLLTPMPTPLGALLLPNTWYIYIPKYARAAAEISVCFRTCSTWNSAGSRAVPAHAGPHWRRQLGEQTPEPCDEKVPGPVSGMDERCLPGWHRAGVGVVTQLVFGVAS